MNEKSNDDTKRAEASSSQDDRPDDREGLGFRSCGRMVIGYVDEVNGETSLPCPDFVPTRHELRELTKYWADRVLYLSMIFFYDEKIGSDESRLIQYGLRRVNHVIELLGRDAVQDVLSEVEEEYKRRMGEKDWGVFWGESLDAKIDEMYDEISQKMAQHHGEPSPQQPEPPDTEEQPAEPVPGGTDFFARLKKLRDGEKQQA